MRPQLSKIRFYESFQLCLGKAQEFMVPRVEEGPLFVYKSPELVLNGPNHPPQGQLPGYSALLRPETPDEIAGGYDSRVSCLRSLQDAVAGLYYRHIAWLPHTTLYITSFFSVSLSLSSFCIIKIIICFAILIILPVSYLNILQTQWWWQEVSAYCGTVYLVLGLQLIPEVFEKANTKIITNLYS